MDNKQRVLFKKSDIIVIAVIFALALAFFSHLGAYAGSYAVICADGEKIGRISLRQSGDYFYPEIPNVIFTVSDGKIKISENNCKDKICVKTGGISHVGESIVCMPKKITVEIKGGSDRELDAVIR